MNERELIQLYRDLTASGEGLARSVAMFLQSAPLADLDAPPPDIEAPPAIELPVEDGALPPPGAED